MILGIIKSSVPVLKVLVSVKKWHRDNQLIAGTRPRGATDEEDKPWRQTSLSDEKETAEHRMLVDLGRNDIGRISETASVQVTKYMVELFRYVMHLTSVVKRTFASRTHCYGCLEA